MISIISTNINRIIISPGGRGQQACIHNLSKQALEQMCRKGGATRCPVAGCNGMWSVANAVLDEDKARQVARYLRKKEVEDEIAKAEQVPEGNDFTQL